MRPSVRNVHIALVTLALIAPATTANASPSATAARVAVVAGQLTRHVDAHLQPGASISGTIRSRSTGHLVDAFVAVFLHGRFVAGSEGTHYSIGGLAASPTGYALCVANPASESYEQFQWPYMPQCYKDVVRQRGVPSTATLIPLSTGQRMTVNFALDVGAAVSGRVRTRQGNAMAGVRVQAINLEFPRLNFTGITDRRGHYRVAGLTPSSAGYAVCFDPRYRATGTGYRPRCYRDAPWAGPQHFPRNATPVLVRTGKTRTRVSVSIPRAAAVAGRVVDAVTGKAIRGTEIHVFGTSGREILTSWTGVRGRYKARDLPASQRIRVCIRPIPVSLRRTYRGQCWRNVRWNGGRLPHKAARLRLRAGRTRTGIDFRLHKTSRVPTREGGISGTVTEAAGAHPVPDAVVEFYRGDVLVARRWTNGQGQFTLRVAASDAGYAICVRTASIPSTALKPATGWAPQCYGDVAWDAPADQRHGDVPREATRVQVRAGIVRSGVAIRLPVGGGITGTVYDAGTATARTGGFVMLFSARGRVLRAAPVGAHGTYVFNGLAAHTATKTSGYVVCFYAFKGYAAQCYADVPWELPPVIE